MSARASKHKTVSPLDLLLPYQRRWVEDRSRWKIGLWSRQVGKDFSAAAEGVADCFRAELRGEKCTWLVAAPSERQALESLEKWKEWVEAFKLSVADLVIEREGHSETLLKAAMILFPKGSRVIAVPGKPDTVRGYSANVLLTEFAFFEDPDRTWRAIIPSITNPLRGGEKRVRLVSTPNGQGNRFHELWQKNYQRPNAEWSCHRVTIHDAVAQGLPVDIAQLRAGVDDPECWAQEYECEFMDTTSVLLPYDLISSCESAEATTAMPPEFFSETPNQLFCGVDFGRKHDLTVCWTLERIGDVLFTREVLELRDMSTPQQFELLLPRLRAATAAAFDYTGAGVGLGDALAEHLDLYDPSAHRFGPLELVTFTNAVKLEIFPRLRAAFERRALRIPSQRVIREDLHSVQRLATSTGQLTYRAAHTPDGHADRATALALAVRASAREPDYFRPVSFSSRSEINRLRFSREVLA